MELQEKMTAQDIFAQIVGEAPKYEFCDAVKKENVLKGFIRGLWTDWCTNAIADVNATEMEERAEIAQFLMKARNTVAQGEWEKATACIKALREIAERMEIATVQEIVKMAEQQQVPFDVLTQDEEALPFVPVEYERD